MCLHLCCLQTIQCDIPSDAALTPLYNIIYMQISFNHYQNYYILQQLEKEISKHTWGCQIYVSSVTEYVFRIYTVISLLFKFVSVFIENYVLFNAVHTIHLNFTTDKSSGFVF